MHPRTHIFLKKWHKTLNLKRQTPKSWHRTRLQEELLERRHALTRLQRLSETSDVLFCLSRARYDGFPIRGLPGFGWRNGTGMGWVCVYGYMVGKFTLRWSFWRFGAWVCGVRGWRGVNEVVNPGREGKVGEVAGRHCTDVERERFRRVVGYLRMVWPLLP